MEVESSGPFEAASTRPGFLDEVIIRIRRGEVDAFEDLMALTEKPLLTVAWRILGERDLARDAAQEAYLRIYRSLDHFRLGENFHAWMYRITVNVCYDLMKKRGPSMGPTEDLENLTGEYQEPGNPEEDLLLEQRRALVRQALGSLTPAERSALVLRDLHGLSTQEAAMALGVRPATVRSQAASARAKVRAFCARLLRRNAGGFP